MRSLLVLIALGLLSLFYFSNNLNFFQSHSLSKVGYIKSSQGTLMGKSAEDEYFKNLNAGSSLPSPIRLVTGLNSQATLFFGEEFKMAASSSLELLKRAGRYEVHILSGKVERKDRSPVVDFYWNHKKMENLKISTTQTANLSQFDNLNVLDSSKDSLSQFRPELQTKIQETFKLHQRFIEKCFIKHYERSQGQTQSGRVLVQFKIIKKGNISDIKIVGSDYKDEDFHSCLIEVISRVQLKYFDNLPTVVNFPILLQLPH